MIRRIGLDLELKCGVVSNNTKCERIAEFEIIDTGELLCEKHAFEMYKGEARKRCLKCLHLKLSSISYKCDILQMHILTNRREIISIPLICTQYLPISEIWK